MSVNLWIKQLDFITGEKGLYPDTFFSDNALRDSVMGKKEIRSSEKLAIAFLGQSMYFRQAAIEHSFTDVDCHFISHSYGANPDRALGDLKAFNPDIVIVFRPELFEDFENFLSTRVAIGYFTESLPTKQYLTNQGLIDKYNFLKDTFISRTKAYNLFVGYNPIFNHSLSKLVDVWSYFPLPVRDDLILPTEVDQSYLSVDTGLFVGRMTDYRSSFLEPIKHKYAWTVLDNAHLVDLLPYSIALNLHADNFANFENRNLLHMALGHLVLTEPQEPNLDLSPGFTHLEFSKPKDLLDLLEYVDSEPNEVRRLRDNGRQFVNRYSSSKIWSKLIEDLSVVLK